MSWNGVKKQSIKADIEAWCEEMKIENYTINDKGEIDVNGNIWTLKYKDFKELPYKFGKVNGSFDLSGNPNLISLKNCPDRVEGYFSCAYCPQLNSLKGSPNKVNLYFKCSGCPQLDSLDGCPTHVGWNFECSKCKRKFTKEEVMSLCKVKGSVVV